MPLTPKEWNRIRTIVAEADRQRDERIAYNRLPIIETDPNAPLCINCKYCVQQGFLFECPLYALPEDGKVVGEFGIVYYRRKGHKPKTYPNVPMKSEECECFEPLIL